VSSVPGWGRRGCGAMRGGRQRPALAVGAAAADPLPQTRAWKAGEVQPPPFTSPRLGHGKPTKPALAGLGVRTCAARQARMKNEYGVDTTLEALPYSVARRARRTRPACLKL